MPGNVRLDPVVRPDYGGDAVSHWRAVLCLAVGAIALSGVPASAARDGASTGEPLVDGGAAPTSARPASRVSGPTIDPPSLEARGPMADLSAPGAVPASSSAAGLSSVALPADAEVLADDAGPYAWRVRRPDGRWVRPEGDAVLIDEGWWTPLRPLVAVQAPDPTSDRQTLRRIRADVAPTATRRLPDRLTHAALGDVTLDGTVDLVLSFRRPFHRNLINMTRPRKAWTDEHGLSAHVGIYRPDDLSKIWIAGTLVRPVVDLAACDGALAVAYGTLDEPGTVATDAWRWAVFGFLPVEPLPGPGTPICVDIDGDGRTEPAITGRSAP